MNFVNNLAYRTKLASLTLIALLALVVTGFIGILKFSEVNRGLETIYNDLGVPLNQLKAIADAYAVDIVKDILTDAGTITNSVKASDRVKAGHLNEQKQGIGQINTAVTQLDQMTQENLKIGAEADSIARATIDKASTMVADVSSKNFVGKDKIQSTETTRR